MHPTWTWNEAWPTTWYTKAKLFFFVENIKLTFLNFFEQKEEDNKTKECK